MWKCKNCGVDVKSDSESCWRCGYGKDGTPASDAKSSDETGYKKQTSAASNDSSHSKGLLMLCGAGFMVAGLIGGLMTWIETERRLAGTKGVLIEGIGRAVIVAFLGFSVSALFFALAEIIECLRAIVSKLSNNR